MATDGMMLGSIFEKLSLSEKSALSLDKLEKDYVLDIATQTCSTDSRYLAATSSNYTIRLFSRTRLAGFGAFKGHDNVITGVCWSKSDPNILLSSSIDKTVRCWDVRTKMNKEVQKFEGSDETNNLFTCVDINSSDRVICGGMEAQGDDVYLLFWDRRGNELLGCYSESHQDDITQVRFHPSNSDRLVSGSTDGLVCLFDISQDCEDDALTYTLNSCSSVANVGWCGKSQQNIYCTTHIDTVHVWDTLEGDAVFESTDIKDQLKGANSIDYIVDCLPSPTSDIHVLTGKHNGDMRVVSLSDSTASVKCSMTGGHSGTVRCAHWDSQSESLVTGAEDSLLCLWSTQHESTGNVGPSSKAKLKRKTASQASRRKNPY